MDTPQRTRPMHKHETYGHRLNKSTCQLSDGWMQTLTKNKAMECTSIFEEYALIMQISVYSRKIWFLFSSFRLFYELFLRWNLEAWQSRERYFFELSATFRSSGFWKKGNAINFHAASHHNLYKEASQYIILTDCKVFMYFCVSA